MNPTIPSPSTAQLAGAVEYTNCISADFPNGCPRYDIKQFDVDAPVLELWRMSTTPSLPLLQGPIWHGVVAPDRVLSMAQIELFDV